MMTDIKKLIQTRNGHKLAVKKAFNTANEIFEKYRENLSEISIVDRSKLQSLKRSLDRQSNELDNLNRQIETALSAEDIEREIVERSEFDEFLHEAICLTEICLEYKANSSEAASDSSCCSRNTGNGNKKKINLPKLQLPTFNGNPLEWVTFWDSFQSAIGLDDELNDVDKFKYLRSYLGGAAYTAIEGLPISNGNYKEVVNILQKRFGSKQVIISNFMNTIMKLPIVSSFEDLKSLRSLYDKTETVVRGLRSIGTEPSSYGTFITPVLMAKIPEELRVTISRNLSDDEGSWDLEEVLDLFGKEVQLREKCVVSNESRGVSSSSSWRKPNAREFMSSRQHQPSTVSALYANQGGLKCFFCDGSHVASKCTSITNPQTKMNILREKGRCFLCFKTGHVASFCPTGKRCFNCNRKHHIALCNANALHRNSSNNRVQSSAVNVAVDRDLSVLLQTAKATVLNACNDNLSANVRVLFDSGSSKTFVSSRLCNYLKLPIIGKEKQLIKVFGESEPKFRECDVVQFTVVCSDGLKIYMKAYSIPLICSPLNNQCIDVAIEQYPYLQGLPLADSITSTEQVDIDLLIGSDYYWSFVGGPPVRGEGPTAVPTRLGFVLNGPVKDIYNVCSSMHVQTIHVMKAEVQSAANDFVDADVNRFWDIESVGLKEKTADSEVYDQFVKDARFKNGRYEVSLPMKECHPVISDNFSLAKNRLNSLLKRLNSKPDILEEYNDVISQQLDAGVIERVEIDKMDKPGEVHFLPHREVVRADKETIKLRVVYDASSKRPGEVSLNDCMHTGPALIPMIFDVLLRFRMQKVPLIGDLEKAFLNIAITPSQRGLLRFLWVNDIDTENPKLVTYRFTRLVFGLVSSPFVLNATIRHHMDKYERTDPDFVDLVKNSTYVDDFASSVQTTEDAFALYQKLKFRFKEAGFNMRKWASNSSQLMNLIECEESKTDTFSGNSPKNQFQNETDEKSVKVLGIPWVKERDVMKFDLNDVVKGVAKELATKRAILSTIARVFDPHGLISCAILPLKILFHEVCLMKVNWDTPLSEQIHSRWKAIIENFESLSEIEFPRCLLADIEGQQIKSFELHSFSDASKIAIGANVYLRIETDQGWKTQLIASKTKIVAMKDETIPRLELSAALLSAQLLTSIVNALYRVTTINKVYCWCDSQIVLWWIYKEPKEFKTFVANRLGQIRDMFPKEHWFYCPTDKNPSDIGSRGIKIERLVGNQLWWHGPDFLIKDCENWPSSNFLSRESSISDMAVSELKSKTNVVSLVCVSENSQNLSVNTVIPCERFSSYTKLIRITALVLKFIKILRNKQIEKNISKTDFNEAESLWHREVQKSFKQDVKFQKSRDNIRVVVDDDGLMRVGGRIENSTMPFSAKFPILLPREHHFTKLYVWLCHFNVKHNGVRETLTELRSKYWIIGGRQVVRKILSKCIVCKKFSAKPFDVLPAPPLPSFRVADDFAFTRVGVDFAGPLYVQDIYSKDKSMHKCYIALFTCASTRAIHLELTPDLSSDSFMRVLQRFIGRRGLPSLIVSDNGSTFRDSNVRRFVSLKGIHWIYNVPAASWWGGMFEICVKLTKRCLRKTLGSAKLKYEELETVIIETEGILNSRPLTYVHNELTETPLTPAHLVCGRRLLDLYECDSEIPGENSLPNRAKEARLVGARRSK